MTIASTASARQPPEIVIVGGGFGGLETARALARAPARVTIVDQRNHHCFQPLLYQVATAALSPSDVAWPIRSILSRQANVEVVMADVTSIDVSGRAVVTSSKHYPFDYLVLATGATHSYFGRDDWTQLAPGLKNIEDATRIRSHILRAFELAEIADDPDQRVRLMTFAVIGGGPTGVELAGALAETARFALSRDFRHIDPGAARIVLLEAGPRLLAAFPESCARYARRALERMGVEVLLSTAVTQCDARGLGTAAGARIEASTLIWAAGVAASSASAWLGAEHDRAGRILVMPDLSVPGLPHVFAIGDTALSRRADGRPVPGIAPAAKQMGRHVARVIRARLDGRGHPGPFRYRHYGDLATIGRKSAVIAFGRFRLHGFPAWCLWGMAHIYFLIGVRNRMIVALDWAWNYLTYQRGARLIE